MPDVVRCKRGKKLPPNTVYVGRPGEWGNPFVVGKHGTREECIAKYRDWLEGHSWAMRKAQRELRGKNLACWCAPLPCHADVLLEIANG
jgi:hypothetical protein